MKIYPLILCACLCAVSAFSQDEKKDADPVDEYEYEGYDDDRHIANFGVGFGLDYGGIGVQLAFMPIKSIALFGALGYNLDGAGYNAGISFLLMPSKKVCPKLVAMYGYNAVIVIKGADQYNKTYLGPSIGGGVQINTGNNQNFINVELLIPFRSSEFSNDMKALQNNSSITGLRDPLPFTISVGYHMKL
jgi:hypothetical protein